MVLSGWKGPVGENQLKCPSKRLVSHFLIRCYTLSLGQGFGIKPTMAKEFHQGVSFSIITFQGLNSVQNLSR